MSGAATATQGHEPIPDFKQRLGHPKPLWMLFMTEFWERFAFYGIRWALVLYIVHQFHGGDASGEASAVAVAVGEALGEVVGDAVDVADSLGAGAAVAPENTLDAFALSVALGVRYLHLLALLKAREGDSDGGYAVSDYGTVRPDLGTMDDLESLATDLRHRGVSLVIDLVLNHVAREHEWAVKARGGDPRYRDYFHVFPDRTQPDAVVEVRGTAPGMLATQ